MCFSVVKAPEICLSKFQREKERSIVFIHSSIYGHVDCFHILSIVNKAAVTMGLQISPQDSCLLCLWIYTQKWDWDWWII